MKILELKYLTVCPEGMFNLPGNIVSVYVDGSMTMKNIMDSLILSCPEDINFPDWEDSVIGFFEDACFLQCLDIKDYLKRKFRADLPFCKEEDTETWDLKVFFRIDSFKR